MSSLQDLDWRVKHTVALFDAMTAALEKPRLPADVKCRDEAQYQRCIEELRATVCEACGPPGRRCDWRTVAGCARDDKAVPCETCEEVKGG